MAALVAEPILGLAPALFLAVLAISFFAGVLHGATGMAGGLVMAGVFSHVLGIKVAVIVITTALIISHCSRVVMMRRETNWAVVRRVLAFGAPTIVLGAVIFGYAKPEFIAMLFAGVLLASFPIKYWARSKELRTGPKLLASASVVWGLLAGNVIGPGFFLAPFLQGTGMNRLVFVGSLASVTLVMNIIKLSVFSWTALITWEHFFLGLIVGLASVPGNVLGKRALMWMSDTHHRIIIDLMTLALIGNFVFLAVSK